MKQYLELSVAPAWELISDVRRFVAVFCERVVDDPRLASRVALAVHELLENAVRYGTAEHGSLRVEIAPDEGTVTIEVHNRASSDHIERLQSVVDDLAERDPEPYLQERMRKTAAEKEAPGLGLSRVRAESDMELSMTVEDGDSVRLVATGSTR